MEVSKSTLNKARFFYDTVSGDLYYEGLSDIHFSTFLLSRQSQEHTQLPQTANESFLSNFLGGFLLILDFSLPPPCLAQTLACVTFASSQSFSRLGYERKLIRHVIFISS